MPDVLYPALHGRQHCPGGEDPIPCWPTSGGVPDLVISFGATIAPTDTWMPIPFEDLAYPPTTTLGDIFSANVTDVGDTGQDRWEITTHEAGWYAYELVTAWDQVGTAGTEDFASVTQRVTFNTVGGFAFFNEDNRDAADWNSPTATTSFEIFDTSLLHSFYVLWVPASRVWKPSAIQRTGVDRGLSGHAMKFWFLGADDLSTWTFDSV